MFGTITKQHKATVEVQQTSDAVTKLSKHMKEVFKDSLKKDIWEGIKWTEPHEFTNDAVVARWKEETDKWKAVRIFYQMRHSCHVFSQKDLKIKSQETK